MLLKNDPAMDEDMNGIPLVSICCVTYNHEKFIRQCLDGFLMQETNFPFEILIHEDASTDHTALIIKGYEAKYSSLFRCVYQSENQFLKQNTLTNILIPMSRGKYIALCEGDDYWTDATKLQKQIDFLEDNPDFAICFHNAKIRYEDEPEKIAFSNPVDQPEISKFDDIARGEFIYTPTGVFKVKDFRKFPEKYYAHINNYTLDLHNAQFGKIKYINEVMCVYRRHAGGIWSMVSRDKTLINQLPAYKFYLNYFPKRYRHFFVEHLKNMTNELISIKMANKDYKDFWKYFKDYTIYNVRTREQVKPWLYIFLKANYDKLLLLLNRKK